MTLGGGAGSNGRAWAAYAEGHEAGGCLLAFGGDGRLIGMVTIRDVLPPLYPNEEDDVHDYVQSRDVVGLKQGYAEVLAKKAEEVVSRNPLTVVPGNPMLAATSTVTCSSTYP